MYALYSHVSEYVLNIMHRLPRISFNPVIERPSNEEDNERLSGVSDYVFKHIYRLSEFSSNLAYERLANGDHDEGGDHEKGGEHVEGHLRRLTKSTYRICIYLFCSLLVLLVCFIGTVITPVYSYCL